MSADLTRRQVVGRGLPLHGNDIDTDRIIPARFLKAVTFAGLGEHAFEDARKVDPEHPFNQRAYAGASVMVVGANFGCGSSREHAPQALLDWGSRPWWACPSARSSSATAPPTACRACTPRRPTSTGSSARWGGAREPITVDVERQEVRFGGANDQGHHPRWLAQRPRRRLLEHHRGPARGRQCHRGDRTEAALHQGLLIEIRGERSAAPPMPPHRFELREWRGQSPRSKSPRPAGRALSGRRAPGTPAG